MCQDKYYSVLGQLPAKTTPQSPLGQLPAKTTPQSPVGQLPAKTKIVSGFGLLLQLYMNALKLFHKDCIACVRTNSIRF